MTTETPLLCAGPCRPADHGGPRRTMHGSPLCDICVERLRENLEQIADAWPDLTDRLGRDASSAMSEKVKGTKNPGLVLNEHVSDTMREVTGWVWFVARVILDERDIVRFPDDQGTDSIARWIARRHLDWLVRHHDHSLVAAITSDAADNYRATRNAAYPSGARRLILGPCTEHTTAEDGSRAPCTGTLYALIRSDADKLPPELMCDADEPHMFTPSEWHTVGRRLHGAAGLRTDNAAVLIGKIAG